MGRAGVVAFFGGGAKERVGISDRLFGRGLLLFNFSLLAAAYPGEVPADCRLARVELFPRPLSSMLGLAGLEVLEPLNQYPPKSVPARDCTAIL